jgi:hypothetical protein
MNERPTQPPGLTLRPVSTAALFTLAALLLAAVGLDTVAQAAQEPASVPAAQSPAPVRMPETSAASKVTVDAPEAVSADIFEERFGIRVTRVAVTAGGGMIDFRFKILDREKARQVLADPHQPPTLVAEDSGLTLTAPHHMARNIRLQKDAVCFLLYPNARNAVKAGTPVSAVFGNFKVESVKAQ